MAILVEPFYFLKKTKDFADSCQRITWPLQSRLIAGISLQNPKSNAPYI